MTSLVRVSPGSWHKSISSYEWVLVPDEHCPFGLGAYRGNLSSLDNGLIADMILSFCKFFDLPVRIDSVVIRVRGESIMVEVLRAQLPGQFTSPEEFLFVVDLGFGMVKWSYSM